MGTGRSSPIGYSYLMSHPDAQRQVVVLSAHDYWQDVEWLNQRFSFSLDQQIDWSHDPLAQTGAIDALTVPVLRTLVARFGVKLSQRVHLQWEYGNLAITLPLRLVAEYRDDIWFPVTDNVFVFDPHSLWCLELHHEGQYSIGEVPSMSTAHE